MVKTNLKASEIIDYNCTVASISSISRFAFANVWSVCVITSSIYVTFTGVCFAFVNICLKKKGKKEKRMTDQLFVCPVELRQNIECTCTILSISSISRFACANVWSVCVVTNSIYVTFTGVCFACVDICQKRKKGKKEKILKIGFSFGLESYM